MSVALLLIPVATSALGGAFSYFSQVRQEETAKGTLKLNPNHQYYTWEYVTQGVNGQENKSRPNRKYSQAGVKELKAEIRKFPRQLDLRAELDALEAALDWHNHYRGTVFELGGKFVQKVTNWKSVKIGAGIGAAIGVVISLFAWATSKSDQPTK